MPGVTLDAHADVTGAEVARAEVRADGGAWSGVDWAGLAGTARAPGEYDVRVRLEGAAARLPPCAGRGRVTVDGHEVSAPVGPVVVPLAPGPHELVLRVKVSKYERRIACGAPVRVGTPLQRVEGLGVLAFPSPHGPQGGGQAVVFVPEGHDRAHAGPLLVGLHPWNGTMWTYAAYQELLAEAQAKDVVLLLPSGLGNSLYTADAEDEAMRALDALESVVPIDPQRVSVWGASMGGAGATTVGLHHPDRFATITSYFGDSKYDLTTYVRGLLHDEAGAHAVNALDVVDNARHVPVWLIHGEDDATSPIRQSELLADALQRKGFTVRFDRVPHLGHAGALVARFLTEVVDRAATAVAPRSPARVTYRGVRPYDVGAYGVRVERATATGDAFVDLERLPDGVHLHRADGVTSVVLAPGALGSEPGAPLPFVDETGRGVVLRWAPGTGP